jgi:squalene synthase HpnC
VIQTVRLAFAPAADEREAQAYTRELALSHYENFSVISALLPKRFRQDFSNIYAFCRTADDLGDEMGDKAAALAALARFKQLTRDCAAGRADTLIFTALRTTIGKYDIPVDPFLDLIDAFEQDQRISRYQTFDQVVDYCRRSADPVGRLVLYMCGHRDEQRQRLSDRTCTALQLANFWQDVRRDMLERDRIYIPRESMELFNVSEEQIREGRFTKQFGRMMEFEVKRTWELFDEGERLLPLIGPEMRQQIALFGKGGQAILAAIRSQKYDTLSSRPSLSKWRKGGLIGRALLARLTAVGGGPR